MSNEILVCVLTSKCNIFPNKWCVFLAQPVSAICCEVCISQETGQYLKATTAAAASCIGLILILALYCRVLDAVLVFMQQRCRYRSCRIIQVLAVELDTTQTSVQPPPAEAWARIPVWGPWLRWHNALHSRTRTDEGVVEVGPLRRRPRWS